jgi:alpha-tubulin suppressor-like RCC1 family protein
MISFLSPRFVYVIVLLLLAAPTRAAAEQLPSISPDPIAISVRSGEAAGTPLVVANPSNSQLDWRLEALDANSRPATLEGQLDAIMNSGSLLNGPLPLRYEFTGGGAGATSLSGALPNESALLNNGNRLMTHLGGPLVYTDDHVASSSVLGAGGRYFTRKVPGLFVFGAETNGISWFEVVGTVSYGVAKQNSSFELSHSGNRWSAFVVNHVDYWRSINHLVLVDQGGLQQTVGVNSSQQQRITGLSGKRRIYHFLYVTSTTAVQPQVVFENLATRFLDLLPWIGSRLSFAPALGSTAALAQSNSSINFDAFSLPTGSYQGIARLKSAGGNPLATVPVNVQVTAPRLELPAAFSKVMLPGMVAETVRVPISYNLTGQQAWTAALESPASWLSVVSPQGDTPDDLQLRIDPTGLAVGNYTASVRIVSGPASFHLPVTLRVAPLSIRKFLASPNQPLIYAVNQDGKQTGQLIEIDIVSRRILRACDVGQEPSDLDLSENGRQIIVMNTTNPSLTRVNLQDFSVDETIPLSEFSNRNEDVGGHVKCGKGDIVYYVDEQWGPRLRVFNTATRTVLQTLSSESGNSPDTSNNYGYGDIGLSPDRSRLFGWRQYGDGAGVGGTHVVRFSVNPDGTLGGFARSANYAFPNFTREPFETPVLFSRDGSRLVIKDREIDQDNLDLHRVIYPDGIYSIAPNAGIAVGRSAIHSGRGDESLLSLPVASSIQAVSADYSSLVYFNTAARSIGWLDLQNTPGYARMGLSVTPADGSNVAEPQRLQWLPQAGVTRYQVYLGTDRESVESATVGTPEYLGITSNVWFDLGGGLTPGLTYYWRVVPIVNGVAGQGEIRSFHLGGLLLSRQTVETTVVRGLVSHPQSLTLDSAEPIAWTAVANVPWISSITSSGSTPSTLELIIDSTGLTKGYHQGSFTITSADGPITVPVELRVTELNVVKLLRHPERGVVYALHQAAAGEGFSQVLEIDSVSARILRASPLGITAPTDAALDAETGRLFVANAGNAPVRVLDVDAWQPLAPLDLGDVNRVQIASGGRLVTLGSSTSSNVFLWDVSTGEKLATLSAFYSGNIKTDPSGTILYHAGSGSSGSNLKKYRIAANAFELLINGPQIGFGSSNLVLSPDGSRVFWLGRVLDSELNILVQTPSSAEIHATNQSGDLAVTDSKVLWSDSASEVAPLPFVSTLAAISAADARLVRYHTSTRTLHSTAVASITDLPGPKPRPGQLLNASPSQISWSPVDGAVSYRFFLAENSASLSSMSGPTAVMNTPMFQAATPLDFGRFHFWRADAVMADNTVIAGKVQSFAIGFPAGPPLAGTGQTESGISASISDRHLLVGLFNSAQLYAFDPDTGDSTKVQRFAIPSGSMQNLGTAVAMDAGKAAAGAPTFANPASNGGAAFVFRPGESGYWESSLPLSPPSPVASEQFGFGLAASGNLTLVGTGNTSSGIGRVCAYISEPGVTRTQTFSANDGVAADGFGRVIAMQGNHALIAAPGRGSSFNRLPCLYAFNRSRTTGQWQQSQKIAIPGATASTLIIPAISISHDLMAATVGTTSVVVYTRNGSGQWIHSGTIDRSTLPNSSNSFGRGLALIGEQLFIGDPDATNQGTNGGVVFSFRRSGGNWVAGPVIVPPGTRSNFGTALAVRDRWLLVAGGNSQPGWLFQVSATENRTPRFIQGIPTQVVAGRAISIPVKAEDADGLGGLTIDKLQGPAWLGVTDNGNGQALLVGMPSGASGDIHTVQLRVRDTAGAESLHTYQLTLLAPTDLPVLGSAPLAAELGTGQELILRASVSGIGPFQWQWFKDGKEIDGANGSSYLISEVGMGDAGRYHVSVSNVVGSVESAAAEVSVRAADRYAGDWPTFGGSPAHNGRHPAALDSTHFLPAWNSEVQAGQSLNRAAISKGRAVVVPQSRFVTGISVRGLDLKTGESLWSFPVPSSNSTNPPSIHQDKVYFQRGKGTGGGDTPQLFSLDAVNGQQVWASNFGAQWESYEAPAIGDAGIFINGGTYGGMYGFNFNGTERFFHNIAQYDRWTPTLANGRLFSWVAGFFTEHNPYDGSRLWSLDSGWDWRGWSMNTVSAVAGNSAALISTTDLICVDLPTRSIRWRVRATYSGSPGIANGRVFAIQGNAVRSYSLADGAPGLVYQADAALLDQPILFNDRLAISSEAKTWIFNLEDGVLLQTLNAGGRLSYSNGYLLAAGNDGVLRAFIALNYNAKLASLTLGSGAFLPEFDKLTTRYIATVPYDTDGVTITPTTDYPDATLAINGVPEANGSASRRISLEVGENEIHTVVTAEDGITTMTYTIAVTRLPRSFVFNSAADIPLTANGFLTGGFPVDVNLNFHPVPGTALTMVNNTGLGFIHGRFENLAHGERITLQHDGMAYDFVANYHGGSGNDLVLQWADNFAVAWGQNNQGQLGDGSTENRSLPVVVERAESAAAAIDGKTVFTVAAGYLHSLALLHDGTMAAWGYNVQGQLGLGHQNASRLATPIDVGDLLAGKTVIAIAAGAFHNLALCSDGTIISWGLNNHGQLGTGDRQMRLAPVLVEPLGALAGKRVVALAAGFYHSLALCDDGTVAAWGYNDEGELGDGSTSTALVPVAVDVGGVLAGKSVSRIAAGQYHTLALCTDGTLAAWGYNARGQLGDGTTTDRHSPVRVDLSNFPASVSAQTLSAGGSHSLALLADGSLAGWGDNSRRQLDAAAASRLTVPQILTASPGRALRAGAQHSLSERDGENIDVWGDARAASSAVITVAGEGIAEGSRFVSAATSAVAFHSLAILALPSQTAVPTRALAEWREHHFGRADNEGEAADCFDCDHDGIPNLVEYAFGLDPLRDCAGKVPRPQRVGDRLELRFTRPARPDVSFGAEWSPDLSLGSWRDVPDSGSGDEHVFSLPADTAPSVFMRLRVRSAPPSGR